MRKDWKESQDRFNKIDGDNFGACLSETQTMTKYLEWRIRKSDNKMCIIQYYENGKGYQIYAAE